MGYRKATTECRVHLVHLYHLDPAVWEQCTTLRREAGRAWTELVELHAQSRINGAWPTEADLKAQTKGGRFALHSQSIQALVEKLIATIDATTTRRQQQQAANQPITAHYPHRPKTYQTITWKSSAITIGPGTITLSNGRHAAALVLPLPARYARATIVQVELLWRANHYELALTIDTGQERPPLRQDGQVAGVDLGEINPAAMVTEAGVGVVINGRKLRAAKRLRNKRHASLQQALSRCKKGSRRYRRLLKRKTEASAKLVRQQRDALHKAARIVVDFAAAEGVRHLAIGDVRDIQDGVALGRQSNQKVSQWPHGQLQRYLAEKAAARGITTELIEEEDTTRTCSGCGHRHKRAPRGRHMRCSVCGAMLHRDGNGAANIASKAVHGCFTKVRPTHLTYRRAWARPRPGQHGVGQRTPAARLRTGVARSP